MASMDIDGQPLFYVTEGEGRPAIVFIHGYSCTHRDWAPQLAHFRGSHRVVALDQRGHGQSTGFTEGYDIETYGADVCALVETLDLTPAVLVGHSLGCRVVMEAASERPDLVAGAIMVDGSRSAEGDREAAEFHARDMMEERGGIGQMRAGLFEAMFIPNSDPVEKQRIMDHALQVEIPVAHELWVSLQGYDAGIMDAALSGIECPLLLIQSTDRDPDYAGRRSLQPGDTTDWTELAERVVSDVELEVVPNAGHFTMLDAAEQTNDCIARFLNRLPRD